MIRWFALFAAGLIASVPAWAKIEQFPANFTTREIPVDGATIHTRIGGRAGGRAAARLRRHRRHVGAAGGGAGQGPHRHRARPARHGPLVASRAAATTRRPRRGHRRACSTRSRSTGRPGHARHRQHGRLRLRRAVSATGHPLGGDGRAASRHRPLGRHPEEPDALALRFPRARRGTAGRRAASASISTASTTSSRPTRSNRRGDAPHYAALYSRPRRSTTPSTSSRLSARTPSTTRLPRRRQADHAGAGDRRREVLRSGPGERDRFAASDVTALSIANSGHWLMEEQPEATMNAILNFISEPPQP